MAIVNKIAITSSEGTVEREISVAASNTSYDNTSSGLGAENVQEVIDELQSEINSISEAGDEKLNKVNPEGSGSFSLNREADTDIGTNSVAVGTSTIASGKSSYAEGDSTTASGDNSHAEGLASLASGMSSHAEGNETSAIGGSSHAEGYYTCANGPYSHVEGYQTTTSGAEAHAGGINSRADGDYSFVHGRNSIAAYSDDIILGEGLNASTTSEVVVGHYNDESADYGDSSGIAFEVGIGTNENNKKNGFVVFNDGIALATKDVQVVSKDSSGKTTKVSLVDLASSGGGGGGGGGGDVSNKMDKENPVGTGSFSMNRLTGSAVGTDSTTLGLGCVASGEYAIAEGHESMALGDYSEADNQSIAIGQFAHAEGYNYFEKGDPRITTNVTVTTVDYCDIWHTNNKFTFTASAYDENLKSGYFILLKDYHFFKITSNIDTETLKFNATKLNFEMFSYQNVSIPIDYIYTDVYGAIGGYSHSENLNAHAVGLYSHSEGQNTFALGISSHAEGDNTCAMGSHAHTEGDFTIAQGSESHAEGYNTSVLNNASYKDSLGAHAEGEGTMAGHSYAHAEGSETSAGINTSGNTSEYNEPSSSIAEHTEGFRTKADGIGAHSEGNMSYSILGHAEGYQTSAIYNGSHSEGYHTSSSGNGCHGEGYYSYSIGYFWDNGQGKIYYYPGVGSHAEGYYTTASGTGNHAEGYQTSARGFGAHSEGYGTTSLGDNSHAEGYQAYANGYISHAEGDHTSAMAPDSHAEGYATIASNTYSHAEGNQTSAYGSNSHVEGYHTYTQADSSHAEGQYTTASGASSHSGGSNTLASGENSFVHGNNSKATNANAIVLGNGLVSSSDGEIVVGSYNDSTMTFDSAEPVFEVGIGTSDDDRKNAFIILNDGKIIGNSDFQVIDGETSISLIGVSEKIATNAENISKIEEEIGDTDISTIGGSITEAIHNIAEGGGGGTAGVRSITQDETDGHILNINTDGVTSSITIPDNDTKTAENISYTDSSSIGETSVQGAIDYLIEHGGGGGSAGVSSITQDESDGHILNVVTNDVASTITIPDNNDSAVIEITNAEYLEKKEYYDALPNVIRVTDVTDSLNADDIEYDNTSSKLAAATVQEAIDKLAEGGGGGSSSGVRSIVQDESDGHILNINTDGTESTITIPDNTGVIEVTQATYDANKAYYDALPNMIKITDSYVGDSDRFSLWWSGSITSGQIISLPSSWEEIKVYIRGEYSSTISMSFLVSALSIMINNTTDFINNILSGYMGSGGWGGSASIQIINGSIKAVPVVIQTGGSPASCDTTYYIYIR